MRKALAALLALLAATAPGGAGAYPSYALRPVDDLLSGPTDGTLLALHYNPAALHELDGLHLGVYGEALGFLGSYQRAAPLPAGFAPGSAAGPAPPQSFGWVAPGSLVAASWDLGTDSVTLGVGFYTPYVDRTSYAGDGDTGAILKLPTRYHAISTSTYSLWGVAATSVRLAPWLFIGGGFNFAWTRMQAHLFRDPAAAQDGLTCGPPGPCEQWAGHVDESLDVAGWGFGFNAGVLVIPPPLLGRLWLGASFVSALFTGNGAQVALRGSPDETMPLGSPAGGAVLQDGQHSARGAAQVLMAYPHQIYLGARGRLPPLPQRRRSTPSFLELSSWVRLSVPPRPDLLVQLERRPFSAFAVPGTERVPLGQQVAAAVDVDVRESWSRLVLVQALLYESPRAAAPAVTPANLDGHKLDLGITARVQLHRLLWLTASAGATAVLFAAAAGSGFDPGDASRCRQTGHDVTDPSCQAAQDGWARPPAAGSYFLAVLHGGVGLELKL